MCPTGSGLAAQETGRSRSNLRSAFDVLDVDHDGKISRDDLQAFYGGYLAAGSSAIEGDVIGSMISVADADRDGFVEYDEFEKVLGSRNTDIKGKGKGKGNGRRWSLMEDVFRAMDRDGDGKVGHQDLKDYLTGAGFDVNDEDVKAMIRLGGGHENGSGGVSYEGLLKILAI